MFCESKIHVVFVSHSLRSTRKNWGGLADELALVNVDDPDSSQENGPKCTHPYLGSNPTHQYRAASNMKPTLPTQPVSHSPFVLQGNNFSIFILTSNHIFCPMTSSWSSIVDPCYFSFCVFLQSLGLWFFFFFFNKYHPLPHQNSTQWINSLINKHLQCVRSCPRLEIPENDTNGTAYSLGAYILTGGDEK